MPKTKTQRIVFSLLMAFVMVYGMETYNHILQWGVTAESFTISIPELAGLMFAVILLQELIAGRTARRIAFKFADPATARPLRVTIAVQVATVLLMCPMMSLVAAIVFKADAAAPLYAKWLMTFLFNLPMAMLWQLLVAGPLVRGVIKRVP